MSNSDNQIVMTFENSDALIENMGDCTPYVDGAIFKTDKGSLPIRVAGCVFTLDNNQHIVGDELITIYPNQLCDEGYSVQISKIPSHPTLVRQNAMNFEQPLVPSSPKLSRQDATILDDNAAPLSAKLYRQDATIM